MLKETLLHKITGTETPRFVTEREHAIINICLELINTNEEILIENTTTISDLNKVIILLKQENEHLKRIIEIDDKIKLDVEEKLSQIKTSLINHNNGN